MVLRDNQAVHCPTEELANKVIEKLYSQGKKWGSGKKETGYEIYRSKTCYSIGDNNIYYGDLYYYQFDCRSEIISAKKFLEMKYTAKDIIEQKICFAPMEEWQFNNLYNHFQKFNKTNSLTYHQFYYYRFYGNNFGCSSENYCHWENPRMPFIASKCITYDEFDFEEEFVLPDKWCLKVTPESYKAFKHLRELFDLRGYITNDSYCNLYWGLWHNHIPSGYSEITLEQFKKHVLKEDMKTYKLKKKYPGSPEIGSIVKEDMSHFPEFWEEVKEEFKLGDIVVKLKGFTGNGNIEDEKYAGKGYDSLPEIFSVSRITPTYASEMEKGTQTIFSSSGHGIFSAFLRKATPEEIEKYRGIKIGEYKVEKYGCVYKIGCQSFDNTNIKLLRRLIDSPINANIEIQGTKITTELLDKIENL